MIWKIHEFYFCMYFFFHSALVNLLSQNDWPSCISILISISIVLVFDLCDFFGGHVHKFMPPSRLSFMVAALISVCVLLCVHCKINRPNATQLHHSNQLRVSQMNCWNATFSMVFLSLYSNGILHSKWSLESISIWTFCCLISHIWQCYCRELIGIWWMWFEKTTVEKCREREWLRCSRIKWWRKWILSHKMKENWFAASVKCGSRPHWIWIELNRNWRHQLVVSYSLKLTNLVWILI